MEFGPAFLPSHREAHSKGMAFAAKTVNMSRDGFLINCDIDLTPRTTLEITLSAPTDGHPITIAAEVAWSRRNAMNLFGRYAAGLKTRKISERDRDLLLDFFKPL